MAAELAELLPPGHVFQLLHECRRGAGRIAARNRRRRTGDGRRAVGAQHPQARSVGLAALEPHAQGEPARCRTGGPLAHIR